MSFYHQSRPFSGGHSCKSAGIDGHSYGASHIEGNAKVQMGNFQVNTGSRSHTDAPSTVHGDMIVNFNNDFAASGNKFYRQLSEHKLAVILKKTLYYEAMDSRKSQLYNVMPESFDWIWTETGFSSWLRNGQGIYWIVGKPASGKSTLIHYLANSVHGSRTVRQCMASTHQDSILLHFFFDFRAGSGIPNTTVGMLRSLLLQLVQASSLIQKSVLGNTQHRLDGQWPDLESELLDLICEALVDTQLQVCGFIDGLDEYSGNLRALADTIILLQARSGMKLCLASRPEPQLSYKLRTHSLTMQAHNAATMQIYVEAALSALPPDLQSRSLGSLADRIVNEANGVILWARLAVDEVVDAILQGCGLNEATARLDRFPSELEDVYGRILHVLNPRQKLQAAAMLYVVWHWDASFSPSGGHLLLTADVLMLSCDLVLKILNPMAEAPADLDPRRFKASVISILRGLIEFIPHHVNELGEARFAHKTLQVFLQRSQYISDSVKVISNVVDARVLGPWFCAMLIKAAGEKSTTAATNGAIWETRSLKERLVLFAYQQHITDFTSLQVVRDANKFINFYVLDETQHIELLMQATQTSLFRGKLIRYTSIYYPPSVVAMPELLEYLYYDCPNALAARMRQIGETLSREDHEFLFTYAFIDRLSFVLDAEACNQKHSLSGWGRWWKGWWNNMGILLKSQGWQAHFVVLCTVSAEENAFDEIYAILLSFQRVSQAQIFPSLWWKHETTHVLMCWAWTSVFVRCKTTQQKRFDILRLLGVSIKDQIYEKGYALDAIFEDHVTGPQSLLPSYRDELIDNRYCPKRDRPHFSKAKFEVLIESGINIGSNERVEKLLLSARQLLNSFKQKLGILKVCEKCAQQASIVHEHDKAEHQCSKDDSEHMPDISALSLDDRPSDTREEDESDFIVVYGKVDEYEYAAALHDLECHVVPYLESCALAEGRNPTSFDWAGMMCEDCVPLDYNNF